MKISKAQAILLKSIGNGTLIFCRRTEGRKRAGHPQVLTQGGGWVGFITPKSWDVLEKHGLVEELERVNPDVSKWGISELGRSALASQENTGE